jgi:manganese containing catalase
MLEATGRMQKCRLYEMSNNKAFRSTVSYLIVRDLVHEKVFKKHLRLWVSTGAKRCQSLGLIHKVCQRLEIWKERIFTTKCGPLQIKVKPAKLARYSKEIHPLTTVVAN